MQSCRGSKVWPIGIADSVCEETSIGTAGGLQAGCQCSMGLLKELVQKTQVRYPYELGGRSLIAVEGHG